MRNYFFAIWRLAGLLTRRYFRNRLAIFFTVIFPLIFLFIFGGLFGKSNDTSFKVAVINQSEAAFAKQFAGQLSKLKVFKVQENITSEPDAKERMKRGELDAIIELPKEFGTPNAEGTPSGTAKVLYDQNSEQAGRTVSSILDSVLGGANAQLTKVQPPLKVTTESTAAKGLSGFDYIFSGLLGFSILGLGVFGPINILPAEKKSGALTRLRVTPLRPAQFILGYMLSVLAPGVISIAAMFIVALLFFDFHMTGNYFTFLVFALLSAVTIFGIGVGVGGWAKDEKQAAPLGNLVSFPMMFLSGTFFPRFLMPEWLQHVSYYLPLTPVVDGMRMITTEGKTLLELGPQIGLLGLWCVGVYAVAFRVFRWD